VSVDSSTFKLFTFVESYESIPVNTSSRKKFKFIFAPDPIRYSTVYQHYSTVLCVIARLHQYRYCTTISSLPSRTPEKFTPSFELTNLIYPAESLENENFAANLQVDAHRDLFARPLSCTSEMAREAHGKQHDICSGPCTLSD
jgi:hypothetical protein